MASAALARAEEKVAALRTRMSRVMEERSEEVEQVVGTAVNVGSGFLLGAAEEYFGEDAIFGTSIPMASGFVLTGLAIAGYGGGMRSAMLEAGKAGLCIEAYKAGSRVLEDWRSGDNAAAAAEEE